MCTNFRRGIDRLSLLVPIRLIRARGNSGRRTRQSSEVHTSQNSNVKLDRYENYELHRLPDVRAGQCYGSVR